VRGRGDVRMRRPVRLAVVLLSLSGLAAGCTSGDDDDAAPTSVTTTTPGPKPPPGWKVLREASTVPPKVDGTPLWDSTTPGAPQDFSQVAFRGDAAILVGGDGIAVVDAATGEPRWRVEDSSELPGAGGARLRRINLESGRFWQVPVVDLDGSWAVVVGYALEPADRSMSLEYGVAALAAADGHTLWKRPVLPSGEPLADHTTNWVETVLTDGQTAFVTAFTGPDERLTQAERVRATKLVAVDGRTGDARWERLGVKPQAMARDVVAGFEPDPTGSGSDGPELVGVLLDKATGEPLSHRFDRHPWVQPVEAAGNHAVLLAGTDAQRHVGDLVLVDLTSGAEEAELGDGGQGGIGSCGSDGTLIACAVRDASTSKMHLATYDTTSGSGAIGAGDSYQLTILGAWQDGVFASTGSHSTQLLDRAGKVVQELPGYFTAASDQYVVMRNASPDTDYAVYRVAA
jgi:PQQ-like domain